MVNIEKQEYQLEDAYEEYGQEDEYGDDDLDCIDINSLPNDQQQYFIEKEEVEDLSEKSYIKFNEDDCEEQEDNQEEDLQDDLNEIYQDANDSIDFNLFQIVHFNIIADYEKDERKRDNMEEDPEDDRYNCPETGAHFEFLDMIRRVKKLQKRRQIIDKIVVEEQKKKKKSEDKFNPLDFDSS